MLRAPREGRIEVAPCGIANLVEWGKWNCGGRNYVPFGMEEGSGEPGKVSQIQMGLGKVGALGAKGQREVELGHQGNPAMLGRVRP